MVHILSAMDASRVKTHPVLMGEAVQVASMDSTLLHR